MKRHGWAGQFAGGVILGLMMTCALAADGNASARQVIEKLVNSSLEILRDSKLNADDKTSHIQEIAYRHIDFPTVARLTLAGNWRTLNDKQQAAFIEEYKKHLSNVYANIGRDYHNQRVELTGDRDGGRGDWLVQTRVVGDNTQATRVDYRLRKVGEQWMIIDMIIEDQSMVLNFRAKFSDILQNGGIEHLIQVLREKNAAHKA